MTYKYASMPSDILHPILNDIREKFEVSTGVSSCDEIMRPIIIIINKRKCLEKTFHLIKQKLISNISF